MLITLIGQGLWSKKLLSILKEIGFETTSISAREFLSSPINNSVDLSSSDLVWVVTRPDLQIDILKKLEVFRGKIILEKPLSFFQSSIAYSFLEPNSNHWNLENVYLSRPWVYSNVWEMFKQKCNYRDIESIEISRWGETDHTYIPMSLDWLSHDILLLYDLVEVQNQMKNFLSFKKDDKCHFKFDLGEIKVHMISAINCKNRIATWKIDLKQKRRIHINFLEKQLTELSVFNSVTHNLFYDNPIEKMLNAYIYNSDKTSSQYLKSVILGQYILSKGAFEIEKNSDT